MKEHQNKTKQLHSQLKKKVEGWLWREKWVFVNRMCLIKCRIEAFNQPNGLNQIMESQEQPVMFCKSFLHNLFS